MSTPAPEARAAPETRAALAIGAHGLLAAFNRAGVLGLADVHTAAVVARLCGEDDESVQLALALTVRALRTGSVCVDLRTAPDEVFDEAEELLDTSDLPWPEPADWLGHICASPAVAVGADAPSGRPLRLSRDLLYLERYWQQEEVLRRELQVRHDAPPPPVDLARARAALRRLFGPADSPDRQRLAVAVSALTWVTVLVGGPGTGKTTTVARLLALLCDQPGGPLRVALAAPTGKAAARLEEAVRVAARQLDPEDTQRLGDLHATTVHRLLGWLPHTRSRFRHHAGNHLPYDLIVVDEMSMVSLTLMARLLEAVRPEARLVLVGDPDQLSSVEAGAVLADIAGPKGDLDPVAAAGLQSLDLDPANALPVPRRGVVRLVHTWRFGGGIEELAQAVRAGDPAAALRVLRSDRSDVVFDEVDPGSAQPDGLGELARELLDAQMAARTAAQAGQIDAALAALESFRLMCAHRRGAYGVTRWGREAERWLGRVMPAYVEEGEWYLGRPVLITANDYELQLYNGDIGVVVATDAGPRVAFARGSRPALFPPVRLQAVQTVHAMTVHRAQGSQFGSVALILPPPESPLLTRELLYTAVTRAQHRVRLLGTEDAVRRAVSRPASRASGLRDRL